MAEGRLLLQAAKEGNAGLVRALLDEGSDVEDSDEYGTTALMMAARWGHAEIVRTLLAEGADVNASQRDGMTALMLSVYSANGDVARALLAAGADRHAKDRLGMTAMGWARAKGLAEVERILSDKIVDTAATAGAREVARAGELTSEGSTAATDRPADDVTDLPDVPQAPHSEGESDPSLNPRSSAPQFESASGSAHPAPVKFSDNPDFASTAPPTESPRSAGRGGGALPESAVTGDDVPPERDATAGSVLAYWQRLAALSLAVMIASFVGMWIFLAIKDDASLGTQRAPAAASGHPEATNGTGGGEAAEQHGAQIGDAAGGRGVRGDDALLTAALGDWVTATNDRDIEKLRGFYAPELVTFYRRRKASSSTVMREKARLLAQPHDVNIRVSETTIRYGGDPLKATLRFRKSFSTGGQRARPSEVIQELVWQKMGDGWKIVSERDVRVIRR